MVTTRQDITEWFNRGKTEGAAYMIVACDTFDWEDYPVYVKPTDDLLARVKEYDGPNMQKIMEVYDLSRDIGDQISLRRMRADLEQRKAE